MYALPAHAPTNEGLIKVFWTMGVRKVIVSTDAEVRIHYQVWLLSIKSANN